MTKLEFIELLTQYPDDAKIKVSYYESGMGDRIDTDINNKDIKLVQIKNQQVIVIDV